MVISLSWRRSWKHKQNVYPLKFLIVIIGQLFPYKVTPARIHHGSVYRLLCRHVHATISSGCWFGEPFWFGISLCNNSSFYGHTLTTDSTWVTLRKGGEESTGSLSKNNRSSFHFLRIVSENFSFDPHADYCNIEERKKCSRRDSLEVLTLRLLS